MSVFLVYRYDIKFKKGQLLEVMGTMKLVGYLPAESREETAQKLKLANYKFPGGITHHLHPMVGKSWREVRNNAIAHGHLFGYYIKRDPVKKAVKKLTARMIKPFPLIPTKTKKKNRRAHGKISRSKT
ncbi:MAG: hypothetical protein Q8Q46_00980 [Candidatus Giovannonibacteria bacterium]|nr:hypothetical protein [Candidatus Giovannonibacteria bacterium]